MTNEQYLYVSYVLAGLFTIALSLCVYAWLRRPFGRVADASAGDHWAAVLKRSFPVGMILPALVGFLSVSYTAGGCRSRAYKDIVGNRDFLIAKSHEQVSGALHWTAFAVFVWGILVILVLATSRPNALESKDDSGEETR